MRAAGKTLATTIHGAGSTGPVDPCLLYYGSFAMFQMGGGYWQEWKAATLPALLAAQRRAGHRAGSWDPAGPWALPGGRVGATAMNVLATEIHHRLGLVVPGR